MDERPDGLRLRLACHAVLFDLDGVLADSKAVVERTWKAWAKQHAVYVSPNKLNPVTIGYDFVPRSYP